MQYKTPFTITSFAWRKEIADRLASAGEDHDSEESILAKLAALAKFLETHGLVVHRLTNGQNGVSKDFVLKSDDLTEKGLKLIRKAYDSWQRRAKAPNDVRVLEKALAALPEQ